MYVVLFLFAISIIYIPYAMKMIKKKQEESAAFLAANPTASKIYPRVGLRGLYMAEQVMVTAVNDGAPDPFYDGLKEGQGVYALPGKNAIEVEYARTRPGILHKSVTTTTGPTKQEIEVEANKRYSLGFIRNENRFCLTEL